MSKDTSGPATGISDDSPSVSSYVVTSSSVPLVKTAKSEMGGGEVDRTKDASVILSTDEEDSTNAQHGAGITWTPRWRRRRKRRRNIEDVANEEWDKMEHESRESRLARLGSFMQDGIFRRYDMIVSSSRCYLPRRFRPLSLAVYVAACGILLLSGQMHRMNDVVVPDANRDNGSPYDPWDQEDFRDRGPYPKRKKIKQAGLTKGKRVGSATLDMVDTHRGDFVKRKFPADDHDLLSPLLDWQVPFNEADMAVLWRIPRTAGTVLGQVMTRCYGLTVTNNLGTAFASINSTNMTLRLANLGGERFINVSTTTPAREGLQHAEDLKPASLGLANVIMTPHLWKSAALLAESPTRGRCFALIRHPIDRAVSMFYHLHRVSFNGTFPNMTIAEFARGPWSEENRYVRALSNRTDEKVLRWSDLELAKDILSRKCFIGLVGRDPLLFLRSVRHFEKAFRWDKHGDGNSGAQKKCLVAVYREALSSAFHQSHPTHNGSEVWDLFLRKNGYDLRLYEYALQLFQEQRIALNVTYESLDIDDVEKSVADGAQNIDDTVTHSIADRSVEANATYSVIGAGTFKNAGNSNFAQAASTWGFTSRFIDDDRPSQDKTKLSVRGIESSENATDHHIAHTILVQ